MDSWRKLKDTGSIVVALCKARTSSLIPPCELPWSLGKKSIVVYYVWDNIGLKTISGNCNGDESNEACGFCNTFSYWTTASARWEVRKITKIFCFCWGSLGMMDGWHVQQTTSLVPHFLVNIVCTSVGKSSLSSLVRWKTGFRTRLDDEYSPNLGIGLPKIVFRVLRASDPRNYCLDLSCS